MKRTILLTGAAGFIGSNFLQYMFRKYPDFEFLVLDSLTYAGNPENFPPDVKNSPRFQFWYGSVTNSEVVNALMSKADWVVHFAAESHVARSIFDNSKFFETDVIGTQVMMNALLKSPQVERFLHISTSEVYGTSLSEPMDEEHPLNPRSPYAGAKAGADRLVYSYYSTYDLPVTIVRPFNNYGAQQHLEKMTPRFITSALDGKQLTVHGDGSAKRDWLYVEDHCEALEAMLFTPDYQKIKNQVINLGTGVASSVLEIARFVLETCGCSQDRIQYLGDRPGQVECHISSTDKAYELLGWRAKTKLHEGLLHTINWYKQNEGWWRKLEWMKQVPVHTKKGVEMH